MADIFDEVSQDLRAERAQDLMRRYGVLLIVLAVLIVLGVAGWKVYEWRREQAREAAAQTYLGAVHQAEITGPAASADKTAAEQSFAALAQSGPSGYGVLSRFYEAALKAQAGDVEGASSLWDKISADETVDPDLRQLADLIWVQHHLQSGSPDVVAGRLAPLAVPGQPYQAQAMEYQALLKLRTGDNAAAVATLRQLLSMPGVAPGVRNQAGAILALLGAPPGAEDGGQHG